MNPKSKSVVIESIRDGDKLVFSRITEEEGVDHKVACPESSPDRYYGVFRTFEFRHKMPRYLYNRFVESMSQLSQTSGLPCLYLVVLYKKGVASRTMTKGRMLGIMDSSSGVDYMNSISGV